MRKVLMVGIPLAVVLLLAVAGWLAYSGSQAYAAVNDVEAAVDDLQDALADSDFDQLEPAARAARDASQRAYDALHDPVWAVVAAIPYLGDSAEMARATTQSVATASAGLDPLLDVADVMDPATLFVDGRIAVDRLEVAQEPLAQAAEAFEQAQTTMATAPAAEDGAWIPARFDSLREQAAEQLAEAADALSTASAAADVLPALLGSQGPRTWFVGVQTPAEARGTGGLIGTHIILTADDGRLTLERTASNSEILLLDELPDFGEDFRDRYGTDPAHIANSNTSPHFPYAGRLWQEFYLEATGTRVDVVMATDVVALGHLVEATGPVTLPDGRTLDAEQAVDFGLSGVYSRFDDNGKRQVFQEQVASGVVDQVIQGSVSPSALVTAVGTMVAEKRLMLWSPDEAEQEVLLTLPTSGSVAATPGPYVLPILINATASKLDTYLEREIRYEVGRCPAGDVVRSRLELTVSSDIPVDQELDGDVIGQAEEGPDGPISVTQAQIHLPEGAQVEGFTIDGQPVSTFPFEEQGRPAIVRRLDLHPRKPVTVSVSFIEPRSDLPASLPVQPLARPADVEIVEVPCTEALELTENDEEQ